MIEIGRGFAESERTVAGRLYWEAFERKLGPAFADPTVGREVLTHALRADNALVARADNRVVGICGYRGGGSGVADLRWQSLRPRMPVLAAIRARIVLGLLSRPDHPDSLVLDGICVDADWRGQGIGSRLLDAAHNLAAEQRLSGTRLSVIGTNPHAEALYRRLGYRPVGSGRLGPLAAVYGFDHYLTMERKGTA